jgi:2-phosphoglycerate kinase
MQKVIIIGGAPFTGKTTLARLLSPHLRYPCICTDDLGAAVRAVNPKDPALNPAGDRSYGDYYLSESNEKLVADTDLYHSRLKPAVLSVIYSHLNHSGPAVIEGWSLYPHWFEEADENLGRIWLVSEPSTIYTRIVNNDFFSGHSERKKIIKKYAVRCFWQNRKIEEEAGRFHQDIIRIGMSTAPEELLSQTVEMLDGNSG